MAYQARVFHKREKKRMLYVYAAFLTTMSISVFLMHFGFEIADKTKMLTYLSGIIFWIGFLGTVATAVYITCLRKRSKEFKKLYPKHRKIGLIHFFQNTPACICDVLLLISLTGFAIACIWLESTVVPYIFLSILIFSFGMHCMLNGSNYIYLNYKIRRVTES